MKRIILFPFLFCFLISVAQDTVRYRNEPYNHKGALNTEVFGGFGLSTAVGATAKDIRDLIDEAEEEFEDYKGCVAPKSTAYVGMNVDYRFHRRAAVGTGLVYTPRGFWILEENVFSNDFLEVVDRRKTFITVDYFDIPIFFKEYFPGDRFTVQFGPVLSLAVVSKGRMVTKNDDDKLKTKYRLGEDTDGTVTFNEMPRPFIPGFEASVSYGNSYGLHGTLGFNYSTSMFEDADIKNFLVRLGIGYTFAGK